MDFTKTSVIPRAQAQQLYDRGLISQETLNRIPEESVPMATGVLKEPEPNMSIDPALVNPPVQEPSVDPSALVQPTINQPSAQQAAMSGMINNMTARGNAIGQTYDVQQNALAKAAAAGAAQGDEEHAFMTGKAKELELKAKENEAEGIKQQQEVQSRIQELHNKIDEVSKIEIDPNKYWSDKTTGQKIITGLGLFLGAFGAMQGGINQAAKVVDNAIQRDVNAQIANLNNKKSSLQDQNTLVGRLSGTYKDQQTLRAAALASAYNNAQLNLNAIASKYKSPMLMAKAQEGNAILERAKQEQLSTLEQLIAANVVKQSQMSANGNNLAGRIEAVIPQGLQGKAYEELGKQDELERGVKSLGENFNTVKGIGGIEGNLPFSDAKANVDSAKSAIMATLVANWKGPMSDSDLKRINGLMPDATDTSSQIEIKRKAMEQLIKSKAPATPILDMYGMSNKKQELKTLKKN